ncbi:MAG: DUF6580 family putative transport protein [Terracidiphilus sp.]|jgi:hypothetical protein
MKRVESRNLFVFPYLLILGAALLRLTVSHPYNFIPIFSCLLFFGANRPKREFAIPMLVLVGVDIFLTTHRYGYPLTSGHAITWMWYLAAALLGAGMLRNSLSTGRVIGASLLASVSFFLASNFAVWAEWGMYAKTLSGLGACYIAALPFFRNSLVSETTFSLLIFGISMYSEAFMPARRMQDARS